MRFGRITRGTAATALAAAACLAISSLSPAQQTKPQQDTSTKESKSRERASGVIIKAEKGATAKSHRLTINMNAVWRDWSRDQVQAQDKGPASKDAAKGKDSIATRGEPADANSVVVVEILADTRVETRFRSTDDETSKGSKTAPTTAGKEKSPTAKPVQFRAEDLKPGLFVEVDFRTAVGQNQASTITVIRPVGGRDTGGSATSSEPVK